MLRIFRFLSLPSLALLSGLPLTAQAQLLRPQTIRFVGTQEYTPDELLAAVGVKRGQTYTADFFSATAQKLMAIGVFEKVSFTFDGVDLVYSVGDNPVLYTAVFDNLPLDPTKDSDSELRKRIPLYHGKVPSEGSMFDSVRETLEDMLADQGIKSTVTAVPTGDSPKHKATAMKFRIDAPPVKIGDIHLSGVSDALAKDVARVATHVDSEFSSHAAEHIENAIAVAYRDRGYAAAKIQAVRSGVPVATADAISVPFEVRVEEGRTYKLGSVQLGSSIPFALDDIAKTMPARERLTPDNRYASAVRNAVETRLRSKGYLDCAVTMSPAVDEAAGTVNYTIEAVPGSVYHLGLLKFDNVSDAMRTLLMRSWQMMPGDPFNESYVSSFIVNAQKNDPVLQRSLAGVGATFDVHADPETRDVNVIIRLARP